jgi:pimeloyl-ACP methyl ester carboxylesterase
LGAVLSVAAAGYAAVLVLLWSMQERMIFLGQPLAAEHRFAFGDDVHETWIDVPGARLHALHLRRPAPDGVVFFLHGNAGNLAGWFADVDFYRRLNLDLVMLDYRGYGKSSGRITSQAQLEADVRAAWDALVPHDAGRRRLIVGQSLGAGLAAALAADVGPDALVLVTPFESLEALAGEVFPWVPRALLRYPLRTDEALSRVAAPVWLIHGDADDVVPFAHSERLHARFPHAQLRRVVGGGHNDLPAFPAFHDALREALAAR